MEQKKLLQRIERCIPNRVPVSIYLKNRQGIYQWGNSHVVRSAGLSANDDIVGKSDDHLPWRRQADQLRQIDKRVMICGAVEYLERWPGQHNKTQQVFLTGKSPWYDNGGCVTGVIGISIDITQQKRLCSIAQSAERVGASLLVNQGGHYHSNAEALFYSVKEMVNLAIGFTELASLNAQATLPDEQYFSLQAMLNMSVAWIAPVMVGKGIICHMLLSKNLPHLLSGQSQFIHRIIANLLQNSIALIAAGQVIIQAELMNQDGVLTDRCMVKAHDKSALLKLKITAIGKRRVPAFSNHEVQLNLRLQIVKKIINLLGGKFDCENRGGCSKIFTCIVPVETL